MPDEKPGQNESTASSKDAVANAPDPPTGSGSSVMKLVGIGLGLTAIAALVVGLVFWKTLKDIETQNSGVVLFDPNDLSEADPIGAGGESGNQDAGAQVDSNDGSSQPPASESSDDAPESAPSDETATVPDSEE